MKIKTMSYNNARDNSEGDNATQNSNNGNNPQEEMKQVESEFNRTINEDLLRRQIDSLRVPNRLSVSSSNSANLRSPSLLTGNMPNSSALQYALGNHSSLLSGSQHAGLLAGLGPYGTNLASSSLNQIHADNLLLRHLNSLHSGGSLASNLADRASFSTMAESNVANHAQLSSGAALQGRIGASRGSLLRADRQLAQATGDVVSRRAVGVGASKEMDPEDEHGASDEEGAGESDREEDALSDDAFYKKRNKVETIEDLRLQNETFPVKLYRMLYEVEKDGKADVVSFLPHGRAFYIHKQKEFGLILPNYFSTDRMASFQRQLNLYGFRRITEGKDKGAFFHEKFQHGKRSLCRKIHRKRASRKSSASQGSSSSLSQLAGNNPSHAGLSSSAWGRSVAASQRLSGQRAGSPSAGLGPAMRLGLGGPTSHALGLSNFPSPASFHLQQQQQQQQLQLQQLREQEELVAQMIERQRRASLERRDPRSGR